MEAETIQPLDLGISVADAECPSLRFDSGKLVVTFVDWTESQVTIVFEDVLGLRWQDAEELLPGEPYDSCSEVHNSAWAELHKHQRLPVDSSVVRHINLNFNACGKLSVLLEGGINVSRKDA